MLSLKVRRLSTYRIQLDRSENSVGLLLSDMRRCVTVSFRQAYVSRLNVYSGFPTSNRRVCYPNALGAGVGAVNCWMRDPTATTGTAPPHAPIIPARESHLATAARMKPSHCTIAAPAVRTRVNIGSPSGLPPR